MSGNSCGHRELHCGMGHVRSRQEKDKRWDSQGSLVHIHWPLFRGHWVITASGGILAFHKRASKPKKPSRPKQMSLKLWGVSLGRDCEQWGLPKHPPVYNILLIGKKRKSQIKRSTITFRGIPLLSLFSTVLSLAIFLRGVSSDVFPSAPHILSSPFSLLPSHPGQKPEIPPDVLPFTPHIQPAWSSHLWPVLQETVGEVREGPGCQVLAIRLPSRAAPRGLGICPKADHFERP